MIVIHLKGARSLVQSKTRRDKNNGGNEENVGSMKFIHKVINFVDSCFDVTIL